MQQEWRDDAKCTGVYTPPKDDQPAEDPWFPERGKSAAKLAQMAKAVCNGDDGLPECPVKYQCREYALANNERFGIWGGLSEQERARVRRNRKKIHRERGRKLVRRELELNRGFAVEATNGHVQARDRRAGRHSAAFDDSG